MSRLPSREEALFTDALAQPAARRGEFLRHACGADALMRVRIEALLAAHDAPEELIEPMVPAAQFAVFADEKTGDMIGRYKLLQKIGEGGCGVVYMAEQAEPVRRRVALKVIKAGMDTREVIARFAAERQALALMDHAGIAKVLDAGATEAGRPFFVMELVRGLPITKYCDAQNLPTAARLELFMQVCHAVQHAHQKGVIHRDIKPSNILVTLHDATAVPKVIDFGIAKATQGRLSDATVVTALEQFIGTPAYMSPEQAEMTGLDIDTRSDVYSLGVLLYELLTGRPPFDPKSLGQSSRDEIRRIIREVEPPKPSTRFATLAAIDREGVARLRGTDPAKLRLQLAGDLDWIVMKALEKNRARRYDSPAAFAADVARYLAHEPVTARPPSKLYRIGKSIRRNRLAYAAAAALTLALVAGTVASTLQMIRATHAEHAASVEQRKAEDAQARAEDLLEFMLGDLRKQLARVGRLDVLEGVGDKSMAYFASLDAKNVSDRTLARHAKALMQVGEIRIEQKRYREAEEAFATAYARAATLVNRNPTNGDFLFERAQAEYWRGIVHRNRGELRPATRWLTHYRDSAAALVRLDPKSKQWLSELAYGHQVVAVCDLDDWNIEAARRGFQAEAELLSNIRAMSVDDPGIDARLAENQSWFGTVAERNGELGLAASHFEQHAARLREIAQRDPGTARWKLRIADGLALHASILAIIGDRGTSLARRTEAKVIVDSLVAADPQNRARLLESLSLRLKIARLLRADGVPAKATELLGEILPGLNRLADDDKTDRVVAGRLASASRLHAELALHAKDHSAALQAAHRAIELDESLVQQERADPLVLGETAQSHVVAGQVQAALANTEEARRHWERALALIESRLGTSNYWMILDPAARALGLLGRPAPQREILQRLDRFGYRPLEPWPTSSPLVSNRSQQRKE